MSFEQFSKSPNSIELLKVIASLYLLPQNHGKYVRLETLLGIALSNFNESDRPVPVEELKTIIEQEFPESEMEDRPVNLFTENVAFYQGNSVVFPGIKESGTSILNHLLTSIFFTGQQAELPERFVVNVRSAVSLILGLTTASASRLGLKRNVSEKIIEKKIQFPSADKTEEYKSAITYSTAWIQEYCKRIDIPENTIEQFAIGKNNTPDEYTAKLHQRPLLKAGDEYIFLQVNSSVDCLIQFIWDEAKRNDCFEALLRLHNDFQWLDAQRLLSQMYGPLLPIELPATPLRCKECIFPFDLNLNKLAYVCFLESGFHSQEISDREKLSEQFDIHGKEIEARQQEVFNFLKQEFRLEKNNFFTIYIISEVGFPQPCILPSSQTDRLNVWFRMNELKCITDLEDPDPLLLWKFAKSYTEIINECEFRYAGGMLDVFACFRENEDSLWPINEERPGLLAIMPGLSQNYVRASIIKRDEHLSPIVNAGRIVEVLVYNYSSHGPLYMRIGDRTPAPILLEDFCFPIWFFNEQRESHHHDLIHSHLEAFSFRMIQLRPHIEKYFNPALANKPLMVVVKFDESFKREMRPENIVIVPLESINIPVTVSPQQVEITIPVELAYWYSQQHNEGERLVISTLLKAIVAEKTGKSDEQELNEIIDKVIPWGSSKLLTMLGNANNIQLETRFLPYYRTIQQCELSNIKVNLTRSYGIKVTPERLSSLQEKRNLCNEISEKLYKKLCEKLFAFNQYELLPVLIGLNEACVQQRAARALDLPAKMTAFSSVQYEIVSLIQKEQDRAKTSLAVRCLIELIVAKDSHTGEAQPNYDQIDELVAMAHEMIAWAWLSDGIHMGLHDPKIELLECGRINVDYEKMNSDIAPFTVSKSEIEVRHHLDDYENIFSVPEFKTDLHSSLEVQEVERAFKSTWGIGLVRLQDFIIDLSNFTRRNNGSVVGIDRPILFEKLKETKQNWTDQEIDAALNVLTLVSGWEIGKPPDGYDQKETFPWRYNRALSFVRRPIAKLTRGEMTVYYWGYRGLFASFDNLLSLFLNANLQVQKKSEADKLIGRRGKKKGDEFRDEVADWIEEDTGFKIIPYKVFIKPGAKLNADRNLGDIDILAIDESSLIIYSIECKNTVGSKVTHEIEKEIENYFGKDGEIQKHFKRHEWLVKNQEQLSAYFHNANQCVVKSIFISSEEMITTYIKKDELPMPLISFEKLKFIEKEKLRLFLKDIK